MFGCRSPRVRWGCWHVTLPVPVSPPPKGWPLFGGMLWPLLPAPGPGAQQGRRGQRLWGGAGVGCDPLGSAGGQRRGPGALHRLVTPRITRCTRGCESVGGGGTHPSAGTQTWGVRLPCGWEQICPRGTDGIAGGHRWHPRGTDGRRLLRCPARLAQPQPSIPPSTSGGPRGAAGCWGAGGAAQTRGCHPQRWPLPTAGHVPRPGAMAAGEERSRRELPEPGICSGAGDLREP